MSLSAKREALARIHGRYQRAGRPHQTRILDEFCATCGYHRKAALRLLNRPLPTAPPKRPGPKIIYEPETVLPVLKAIWLASDQPCSKLLQAALPEWLAHHERRSAPLPEAFKKKLLGISPAQIDRLLRPARVQHPKKGLSATRPGTLLRHAVPTPHGPPDTTRVGSVEADTVAHCDDSTEGDYVNSLTFTELCSGWTENRAVWNKSAAAVLGQLKELEQVVPYAMKRFHTDNGGEFLNWALHRHLTGRPVKLPWTRSRACRKNDNAHCEQKNWTHVRKLMGSVRYDTEAAVAAMNAVYADLRLLQNLFLPSVKLLRKERVGARVRRRYDAPDDPPDDANRRHLADHPVREHRNQARPDIGPTDAKSDPEAVRPCEAVPGGSEAVRSTGRFTIAFAVSDGHD